MNRPVCLIVDDEPLVRDYLRVVLHHRGFQSLEAENAGEALRIVEGLGGRIDLLITDVMMPGDMDGIELADSIGNSYPAIPIIVTSGCCDIAPPSITFVRKPFTPDVLFQAIGNTIRPSSTPREEAGMSSDRDRSEAPAIKPEDMRLARTSQRRAS